MRSYLLLSLVLWAPACASYQAPSTEKLTVEGIYTEWEGEQAVTVRLIVQVNQPYHIQANPASDPYLIPTRLEFESTPGMTLERANYPEGNPFVLEGSPHTISVYDGRFEISARYRLDERIDAEAPLAGSLTYQACDHKSCFPPVSVPIESIRHDSNFEWH